MKLFPAAALMLTMGAITISGAAAAAPVLKVMFKNGAASTGWINFEFQDGKRIFIPAKINGHKTKVLLATGLPISDIDKTFAASIGLQPHKNPKTSGPHGDETASLVHGLQIQIGDLSLQDISASAVDFAPLAKHMGHPLPLLLGDDAFNELAVDVDFANHRIAFTSPANQVKPDGAVEVPLIRVENIPLVPVSIEGAPPAQFELGIGNSGEALVYQSYYDPHKLLEGRLVSKRLAAGTGGFIVEPVATLSRVEFAGFTFNDMPAAFIPTSQTGTKSNVIAGDLGLPVLSRFRLIVDYSHDRLYAVPYKDVMTSPFMKDRLGLSLDKEPTGFVVTFVAPNSPAQAAGFKVGDRITRLNGKTAQTWPEASFAALRYGASGTRLTFTLQDGSVQQVQLANYF